MKPGFITIFLLLLSIPGFSQDEYSGRINPTVNKIKLNEARFICEIAPGLWYKMVLPGKERMELDHRRRVAAPFQGYCVSSHESSDDKIIYYVVDYVSVKISATCNGNVLTAQSISDKLTAEQKNILNAADLGTDIIIKIKFKYKNQPGSNPVNDDKIIAGELAVTVVPEMEAEYPGGVNQVTVYLLEKVSDKFPETAAQDKIRQAVVKFTVNEEGQIADAKILRTSTDAKIDKLILDAINKMQNWKPAENEKGVKVKQEFIIPLGGGDGC